MSVNIKNREVEALLVQLKKATGKGTSGIVLELLRREVARLRRSRAVDHRRRKIDELAQRYSARLPARPVAPDRIIGYDENGLPA